jgi:beta-fructofuranosidase
MRGWGDLIPFEHDGEFWLFYLHEVRSDPKPGTAWNLVTTKDLIQFQDQGVSLPHGTDADLDFNAYTGSILVDESGVHHLFYTGQNPNNLGTDGLPLQLVMHATSTDGMRTWVKHPELTFGAPAGYESGDWRDPFVFRDEAAGQWRMLIAARHSEGPERRRGVIAQCTSKDLMTWEYTEPFWDPRRYITHECPDVFSWGDWWYMVYSEFSENFTTRYRMAKSPDGPWTVPARDSIDGRAFYASKTAERDGRRFFFGWIASKEGNSDDGAWQWAGTMAVLEARQNPDGTLAFGFADELVDSFWDEVPLTFNPGCLQRLRHRTATPPPSPTRTCPASSMPRQYWISKRAPPNADCCFAPARTGTTPTSCAWNRSVDAWFSTAGRGPSQVRPNGTSPATFRSKLNLNAPVTSAPANTPWKWWSRGTCASPSWISRLP